MLEKTQEGEYHLTVKERGSIKWWRKSRRKNKMECKKKYGV